jgi:hypothetical protein
MILVGGSGYAVWQYGPKLASKPASTPVGTAPAANTATTGEKPILETAIAPANGQQQGAGVRGTFQNSKAITDANSHNEEIKKLMTPEPKNNAGK